MMMKNIKSKESKVATPAGRLYIKEWLPETLASDTPIILLHDSLGSAQLWKSFPELLASRLSRRVIAYDRLGFGQSDARIEPPSVDFIKEESSSYFPAIKAHCAIQKYSLLGHSVGGGMSLNIAANDKDCESVISISAQAFVEDITLEGIISAKEMFSKPGQLERLAKWHGAKAEWVLAAWTETWLSPEFAQWSLGYCIKDVTCPVLVIHGENDEYGSQAFPDYIAGNVSAVATKKILKDCGHMPHHEKSREVIDSIVGFIG